MWDRFKSGKKDNRPILSVHKQDNSSNTSSRPQECSDSKSMELPKLNPVRDFDIHQIVASLYEPILDGLLKHPLFISTVIKHLESNPELIKTVVTTCFESFESKYDITPTQIYKDKLEESKTALENLNRQIEERSEVFEDFRTQIVDFQKQSSAAYLDSLSKLTEQLLQKYK